MDKFAPIFDRLKEPSTWGGIGMVAVAFGLLSEVQAAQLAENIPTILGGLAAIVAVFLKEKK
jgi:hypothetical protein